jgi:hypothetical protein
MGGKYWYKIETSKGGGETYHYVGSSLLSPEIMAENFQEGDLIRLDDLLYKDRGDIKDWSSWDKSLEPSVLINPVYIISIMQFKGDPRVVPYK